MFTPADEKLVEIIEEGADNLVSEVDMELDEGHWRGKFYRRCSDLGLDTAESVKMIEVAEEIICIRLLKCTLDRIKTGEES